MKRRFSNILMAVVLVSTVMLSLTAPLAALDPHEDPTAVTPEYRGVPFLLFTTEYLDHLISNDTFDTNVFLNQLASANLPQTITPETIELILSSNSYTADNFKLNDLMSQTRMSLATADFDQAMELATQAQDNLNNLNTILENIAGQIPQFRDADSFLENSSGNDLLRLMDVVQNRIDTLHEYLDQQQMLTEVYIRDAVELAGLALPELTLAVLPDNAFVGDHIGFQGDILLDGEPLAARRVSIQSDGVNIATVFTNAVGHYQGTLQIPERYQASITLQAIYIPPETDAADHLPALSREVSVRLRYYPVTMGLKTPDLGYPGRDFAFCIDLDYGDALPPELAGPRDVVLRGVASDRWGLVLNRFEFVPLSLNVIPRARYAAWLARRFLAEAGSGDMHYVAEIPNTTARFVSAQGVEYFYSRAYQPGDSLNRIDWKHTTKYDELITKNFVEMRGQQALMLVNLAAADDREADAVAYKTLMTALSLAREDIPALVAAYDRQGVKLVTGAVSSRRLVLQALRLVREVTVYTPPRRYLAPPQVVRLKANLKRLEGNPNPATTVLAELMRLEMDNLKRRTAESPVSEALRRVGVQRLSEYTVMLISGLNHDADAIAYQRYQLENRGVSVINV